MKNFQRATLACSASVIAALCLIAPASASAPDNPASGTIERASSVTSVGVQAGIGTYTSSTVQPTITAPATAKVEFSRPVVTSIAAPKPVEVVKAEAAPVAEAAPAANAPVAQAAAGGVAKQAAPAVIQSAPANVAGPAAPVASPAAPSVSASGKGAAIAAAAMAQLGVGQDCTALATNSLKAVGINFHGWPADYMSLGNVVSQAQAQPGDLIYYANGGSGMAHIAVYIGNGKAVHGGWNGSGTVVFNAHVGSGPVFIHVR